MELRHLRYFTALAEELHFGRAAQRLHISQPSLSLQIRELEEELKLELFARTKRSVELTPAGKSFLADSQNLFRQLERAVRTAQRTARGEIGRLVIGFVLSATCSLLPDILRVFREQFPDVELELDETTTGLGLAALAEGRMHLCFVRNPVGELAEGYERETILNEPLLVALPAGHRLAASAKLSLRQLAKEPFIIFPRVQGIGFYDHLVSLCRQSGFSPKVVQEAGQMQTILSLVAAGIGVALIPATVKALRTEGVAYRPLRDRVEGSGIAMVWRRDSAPVMLNHFIEVTRSRSFHIVPCA